MGRPSKDWPPPGTELNFLCVKCSKSCKQPKTYKIISCPHYSDSNTEKKTKKKKSKKSKSKDV